MSTIDINDKRSLFGAVYFVVGRGTEGGAASYRLSIAGVTNGATDRYWGQVERVADNSGYSLGTIQVDLGQRGTWPLGAIANRALATGERSYVDAIIDESSRHAKANDLKFTDDLDKLRRDLLSHGNGEDKRPSISFMDPDTRDSINAWTGSEDGKRWIHRNIDYAQVKNATEIAASMVQEHGKNIAPEHRFQTICLLAKTANQMPAKLRDFKKVMDNGGNYADLREKAEAIHQKSRYYDGLKAADIAERFQRAYDDPEKQPFLERAATKVNNPTYDPSRESNDLDVGEALQAIARPKTTSVATQHTQQTLHRGAHSDAVGTIQKQLNQLGYDNGHGEQIPENRHYGPLTEAAVRRFQADHGLDVDGRVGTHTLKALAEQVQALAEKPQLERPAFKCSVRLDDSSHPDFALFQQAQTQVYTLDQQHGRSPNQQSDNLASALVVAARCEGMQRIDIVALSDDASKVWAVQRPPGIRDNFFDQYANVGTVSALNTSMEQSAALWPQAMQQFHQHQNAQAEQQVQQQTQEQEQQRAPAMHR